MNICTKVIQHSHMTIHSKDICAEELVKLFYTYTVESIAFKFFQACAAKVPLVSVQLALSLHGYVSI